MQDIGLKEISSTRKKCRAPTLAMAEWIGVNETLTVPTILLIIKTHHKRKLPTR
jgi:hypothetical protein